MKIPKTPDEFKEELYTSIDLMNKIGDLRVRQFMRILDKVSDDIIVEGAVAIISKSRNESLYVDQKYAGIILEKVKPKTDMELIQILGKTVGNWNKSVQEFPFWLRDNFGEEMMKCKLSEFKSQNLSEIEKDKLKTMKWWLKL